jgi:hypothetical protein
MDPRHLQALGMVAASFGRVEFLVASTVRHIAGLPDPVGHALLGGVPVMPLVDRLRSTTRARWPNQPELIRAVEA